MESRTSKEMVAVPLVLALVLIVAFGVEYLNSRAYTSVYSKMFIYKIETSKKTYYTNKFSIDGDCISFNSGTSNEEIYDCSLISIHKNF